MRAGSYAFMIGGRAVGGWSMFGVMYTSVMNEDARGGIKMFLLSCN